MVFALAGDSTITTFMRSSPLATPAYGPTAAKSQGRGEWTGSEWEKSMDKTNLWADAGADVRETEMSSERRVELFRIGRDQAVPVPCEFELSLTAANVRSDVKRPPAGGLRCIIRDMR